MLHQNSKGARTANRLLVLLLILLLGLEEWASEMINVMFLAIAERVDRCSPPAERGT